MIIMHCKSLFVSISLRFFIDIIILCTAFIANRWQYLFFYLRVYFAVPTDLFYHVERCLFCNYEETHSTDLECVFMVMH
jgi:hypothetical protein